MNWNRRDPGDEQATERIYDELDRQEAEFDYALRTMDRRTEYAPLDEQEAWEALYGGRTRSGSVTPLGADRPPIDKHAAAA